MNFAPAAACNVPFDQDRLVAALCGTCGLSALEQGDQALVDRAITGLDPGALLELAEGQARGADLYRRWLDLRPGDPAACGIHYNLGARLHAAGDPAGAATAFARALQLKPDFWAAALARGIALEAAGHRLAAIAAWRTALPPAAERVALHNQLARLLEAEGRIAEAAEELRASLLILPDQPDVQQHLVHNRQRLAQWPPLDLRIPGLTEAEALLHCGPLACLALTDDPATQQSIAGDWIARKMPTSQVRLAKDGPYGHKRLRIGYLSSDFCRHAMAFLITQVIENHDRNTFEVIGYCASPEDGSEERLRLRKAMDRLVPVGALSDPEVAALIRADEIDILIDLNGLTRGSRLGVLRWRPAPLQVTYLGYIGPIPLPELDGILCDAITVPDAHGHRMVPPPLRIEGCFQANVGYMPPLPVVARENEGLPTTGFVFASATHHYKITADMFQDWCAIVRAVPGSVLWLARDTAEGEVALTQRWLDAGLERERLIFAPRAAPDRYRARLGLADLFLDTFPYNTGTVASDALRMGLPIVTLQGRSFASRMASSLLAAVGQDPGITTTREDYVALAIRIGTDPSLHNALRRHLAGGAAWRKSLGDGEGFTRRLEATLLSAYHAKCPRGGAV